MPYPSPSLPDKKPLFLTILLLLTIVPFSMPCLSQSAQWQNDCKVIDHQDQDKKLASTSPYTYYLCTSTNTESGESHSFTLMVGHDEADTVFAWPGTTSLPDSLNVVALGNPETNEYAMVEGNQVHVPQDELVAAAIHARDFAGVGNCGTAGFHTFKFKSADQQLLEKMHEFSKRELKKIKPPELSEEFRKKVPGAGFLAKHWPFITRSAQSIVNYTALSWGVVAFISTLWDNPIRQSVATFEPVPEDDFKNCPVQILLDTNEFLGDMFRQGVTTKWFTSQNTLREISDGLNPVVTTFQTTGRFIDFLNPSEKCQCSACPGDNTPRPARFTDCLVDVIIQTDVMVFDALRLTNSDLNNFLNSEVPLSGYIAQFNGSAPMANTIVFSIDTNATMNTASVLYANFSNFDTLLGSNLSTCSCPACTPVQTESSKRAGSALVGFTNLAITTASGIITWFTVLVVRKIYTRIKA